MSSTRVFIDRVDAELMGGLDVYQAIGFAADDLSGEVLSTMRRSLVELIAGAAAALPPNDRVVREDHQIPGPDGNQIRVRVYRPANATTALPGFYFIHGGGMMIRSIDASDLDCEAYVEQVGCVVVSVDYRLAPEHPYPAPVEDCYAGLRWMIDHAETLGVDPSRIAVGGPSAGGGLAAGTCLLARDRGGPPIAFQVLVYPMLDDRNQTPSARAFSGILSWSQEHNASGWSAYLGDAVGGEDVPIYAAPVRATDLSGLPPTIVQVGELEVFRDEDIDYATRLLQAGVPTELHVYPGAFHGWDAFAPEAAVTVQMVGDRFAAMRRALQA